MLISYLVGVLVIFVNKKSSVKESDWLKYKVKCGTSGQMLRIQKAAGLFDFGDVFCRGI